MKTQRKTPERYAEATIELQSVEENLLWKIVNSPRDASVVLYYITFNFQVN